MNLNFLDWLMILIPLVVVTIIALKTRKYTRSVADFMAANRCAGRYLVATASGEAGFGAVDAVARFEQFFVGGFAWAWWLNLNNIVWLFILLSGFIIYRYRESRVMTLAQFFEIRYTKSFRLFAGFMAFASGLLTYGIYPAVGARFFVYFAGFPEMLHFGGMAIQTHVIIMLVLLVPGVLLTCIGGQLTLMVVDCIQGIVSLIFYIFVAVALFWLFGWADISQSMLDRPAGSSMFNPFDQAKIGDFDMWFTFIAIFVAAYGWQSQQVGHGFRAAATTPHEQKMGAILGPWRNEARTLMLTVLCLAAYCFLHHPKYAAGAAAVKHVLGGIANTSVRTQVEVPVALGLMLPSVIRGMFAAIMLFAIMSVDATMMHSWGTIFIQDLVVPLQKKPMSLHKHMTLLRVAVVGVAIYAFLFSYFYKPTEYILMFLAFASAMFAGAGAAIIGGFYTRWGTAAGAWGAMLGGVIVGGGGKIAEAYWKPSVYPWLKAHTPGLLEGFRYVCEDVLSKHIYSLNWHVGPEKIPFSGQWMLCFATCAAIVLYIGLSLLTTREPFDLDRMLHRGKWKQESDHVAPTAVKRKFSWRSLIGITPEFTRSDVAISASLFGYRILWFIAFIVVSLWNILTPWSGGTWAAFWHWTSVILPFAIGIIITVWFTWGSMIDLRKMFRKLETVQVNEMDDGTVIGHHNLGEKPAPGENAAGKH
jgi:solute:Na+ symporter, SSS family